MYNVTQNIKKNTGDDFSFIEKKSGDDFEAKVNKYNTNEDYILKNYDKFNLDWKKTVVGILNWIFGKKKNE